VAMKVNSYFKTEDGEVFAKDAEEDRLFDSGSLSDVSLPLTPIRIIRKLSFTCRPARWPGLVLLQARSQFR